VNAEAGEEPYDPGVHPQRAERGEIELSEPPHRRAAAREGPHLVQQVVVYDRQLDRQHHGRDERHARDAVQ
jgi:hypothetical protein